MNKTILVVDDDDILRKTLSNGLRNEGFNVISSQSAENADKVLSRLSVDAIILDRMMTGTDGLTFLQKLRTQGNQTPVIMLTAMGGAENTIAGLSCGASDYLSKPFQFRELVLRLNNILQRNSGNTTKLPPELSFSDNEFFILNQANEKVLLTLSKAEKQLLLHLTSPLGNIAPASPMVAKRLRMKINLVSSALDIITIRGQGYKLLTRTQQPKDTI
ncbi:MAG: response regulator transcription factor [Alphaproteobacteria bacterium]|nr:response regulator transcription factor [Alphaproteobacteria bacterium]